MKKITHIWLACLVLAMTVDKVLVWGIYQYNKAYIIEKYCVNKARPSLKCDGKCHLKKQFTQQENEASKELPAIPKLDLEPGQLTYLNDALRLKIDNDNAILRGNTVYVSNCHKIEALSRIFKPPRC